MIEIRCMWCGKRMRRYPYQIKERYYCGASCQMFHEYSLGIRDGKEITKNSRLKIRKMMQEFNWLNTKESRDNLRRIMQTKEYRKKASDSKLGIKNPMYGKKGADAGHYCGGSNRKYGVAYRGFDWKRIKLKIKERDNFKCSICGIPEGECKQKLQVHHILPYKCTKDNSPENLITVCSKCHAKVEPKFVKVKKVQKSHYSGKVYNFGVENDETYVANGFLVHNCRTRALFTS